MPKSYAVYGKGGSGKSSIAAALSCCFAQAGHRVLHIGCDPKSDSSRLLVHQGAISTVMGTVSSTSLYDASSLLMKGVHDITCVEAGGPEPGIGCAGRGITRTFEVLQELGVSLHSYDIVLYDVLGDVVCGGFAAPLRSGFADHVIVVVSGTGMSLFAANNIMKAAQRFRRNGVALAGLVANYHTGDSFRQRVGRFAEATNTRLLVEVPYDVEFQQAEERRMSICEFRPSSPTVALLRGLAAQLLEVSECPSPTPLGLNEFEQFISAGA